MSKYTPEQRADIYNKAAERMFETMRTDWMMCVQIKLVVGLPHLEFPNERDFPELFMLKPKRNRLRYDYGWYGDRYDIDNFNARVNGLLLAREMALDLFNSKKKK